MTSPLSVLLIHRSRVQVHGLVIILMFIHEVDRSPLPAGGTGSCLIGGVAEGGGGYSGGRGGGGDPK